MKLPYCLALAISFILTIPAVLQADAPSNVMSQSHNEKTTPDEIRGLIASEVGENDPILRVVRCESGFRQYDATGGVLTSTTSDKGVFQINTGYWLKKSQDLGFDIDTIDGNIDMGLWIYKNVGINQWVCAKKLSII